MNYFEAQETFKSMFPGKQVTFELDDKCIRQIECIYTEGELHPVNHVQYEKLKVTVEGMPSSYVPIQPHRMLIDAVMLKDKIQKDVVKKSEA